MLDCSLAQEAMKIKMTEFDSWVLALGYRAPTPEDLVAGTEMIMVEVARYLEPHNIGVRFELTGGIQIKLDDEPVVESRFGRTVYYHCTFPQWAGQCFVPMDQFLFSGYIKGIHGSNVTRYIMRVQ